METHLATTGDDALANAFDDAAQYVGADMWLGPATVSRMARPLRRRSRTPGQSAESSCRSRACRRRKCRLRPRQTARCSPYRARACGGSARCRPCARRREPRARSRAGTSRPRQARARQTDRRGPFRPRLAAPRRPAAREAGAPRWGRRAAGHPPHRRLRRSRQSAHRFYAARRRNDATGRRVRRPRCSQGPPTSGRAARRVQPQGPGQV